MLITKERLGCADYNKYKKYCLITSEQCRVLATKSMIKKSTNRQCNVRHICTESIELCPHSQSKKRVEAGYYPPIKDIDDDNKQYAKFAPQQLVTIEKYEAYKDKHSLACCNIRFMEDGSDLRAPTAYDISIDVDVVDGKQSDIPSSFIDELILGQYGGYLCEKAHSNCDPTKPLLSFKSADTYFSCIKSYYERKYIGEDIKVFDKQIWNKLRSKLAHIINRRQRKANKPLIQPKAASTSDDSFVIAHLCIWKGMYRVMMSVSNLIILFGSTYHFSSYEHPLFV